MLENFGDYFSESLEYHNMLCEYAQEKKPLRDMFEGMLSSSFKSC